MSIRDDFFAAQAKASLWDVAVSIKRGNPLPLDANAVYASYGALVSTEVVDGVEKRTYTPGSLLEYAKTNPVAYPGQICAVVDVNATTIYYLDQNLEIQPVGIIPTGDNKTIEVTTAGAISLLGASTAANGTLPMIDSETGKLVWKTLEDIGAGDGNDNTTYTFELGADGASFVVTPLFNGQPVYEGEGEEKVQVKTTISLDVYTKEEVDDAIDEAVKGILGEDVQEAYDTLKEIQDILEGTDGAKIDGLIETVEANKIALETLNGDASKEGSVAYQIKDLAAKATTLSGYGITDAYTTTELDKKLYEGSYTGKDGEVVSNISENKDKARLISTEEIKKLAGLVIGEDGSVGISGTIAADSVTGLADFINGQVTGTNGLNIESGAEKNIIETVKVNGEPLTPDGNRAVNIAVPTKLSDLDDDISHVSDVVVKTKQTNGEGVVTYESKLKVTRSAETNVVTLDDSALQDAINNVANNTVHSFSANNTPVAADEQGHVNLTIATGSQNGTIAVAGADVAVKGLGTAAYHAEGDFKTVQSAVVDPTATAFEGTELSYIDAISQNTNGVITATKKSYDLQNKVLKPISDNKEAIEAIYKKSGETESGLLITKLAALAGEGNTSTVKANADAIAILNGEANEAGSVKNAIAALAGEDNTSTVKANADAIAALAGVGNTSTVKANADAIAILVGTTEGDNQKSVRAIAAEEINRLIKASDDEDDHVIENIANLVDYVEKNAGEIAALVTATDKNTKKLADIEEGKTVGAVIDAKIAAAAYTLPLATAETLGGVKSAADIDGKAAVNKVYVDATSGIGEVKAISTDNLVQGSATLILNGGNADLTA